jgi:hypothetical protein
MEKVTNYRQLLRQILEGHTRVSAGFPEDIVLTFHAPEMRQYTEFATA